MAAIKNDVTSIFGEEEKSRYRKQRFREAWLEDDAFKEWLEPVPGDPFRALCKACNASLISGRSELLRHASREAHRRKLIKWISQPRIKLQSQQSQPSLVHILKILEFKVGNLLIEGKAKKVFEVVNDTSQVLIVSTDRITAEDGVRAHDMEGKSVISTATTSKIFEYLNAVGIKTHFIGQHDTISFLALKCSVIPIKWVCRRIATGSFLRRNPGVQEGFRFCPPKLETFCKDDANHDSQWSTEQLLDAKLTLGGVVITNYEVDIMLRTTQYVFEVLEKAWSYLDCTLIDMKVEYGITEKGEIVLADVIDCDSWRLWPAGDKTLMVDKQVYRNLKEVTSDDLDRIKHNFQWVEEKVKEFLSKPKSQVVILMASVSDKEHCTKIAEACKKLEIPTEMRVTSAHKGTDQTMKIIAQYEGEGIPTVFITVSGRSNGLGPVTSGNSVFPVINCPPVSGDQCHDVWSSLRLPSGLGCSTVLYPDAAALNAAQILALNDHVIWSRLRALQLKNWIGLLLHDRKLQAETESQQ